MERKEDEIMRAIGNLEGTVRTGFSNMENYIGSVNRKADGIDERLDKHIGTDEAHGSRAERRGASGVVAAASAIITCLALIAALAKLGLLHAVAQ